MGAAECSQRRHSANLWRHALQQVNAQSKDVIKHALVKIEKGEQLRSEAKDWCRDQLRSYHLITANLTKELWKKYDANGDGILSLEKLGNLLRDYLEGMQCEATEFMSEVVIDQFRLLGLTDEELGQYLHNPEVLTRMKELHEEINRLFAFGIMQGPELASKIFRKLDTNGDGIIVEKEFCSLFPAVCDEFFNTDTLKDALIRINAAHEFISSSPPGMEPQGA